MLRDFINIYELLLVFLDEEKHTNTISIYSPAIPSVCELEPLCLITVTVFATKSFINTKWCIFSRCVPSEAGSLYIPEGQSK